MKIYIYTNIYGSIFPVMSAPYEIAPFLTLRNDLEGSQKSPFYQDLSVIPSLLTCNGFMPVMG